MGGGGRGVTVLVGDVRACQTGFQLSDRHLMYREVEDEFAGTRRGDERRGDCEAADEAGRWWWKL